jgi:large subunit ribosomal protein L13
MMPKSKLGRHMMDKLKLYVGPNHPHQAQGPIPLPAISGRPAPAGALISTPRVEKVSNRAPRTPAAVAETEAASAE